MATTYVLYFTAAEHTLYRRSAGGLRPEAVFAADAQGVSEFRAHLQLRRNAVLYIVADLGGEDFDEEQIPFLRGADRRTVINRRLAQRFRDPRVSLALSLGRVAGERREERLLLASFSDTRQFEPWLDAIAESATRLAGVFSTALVAPAIAARLGIRAGPCLIVSFNRAGLRQCYVEDGRLRFARLERVPDSRPAALAALVRSESERLANYLVTLRVLPRQTPALRVLAIAPPGAQDVYRKALRSDERLAFQTIDARTAARAGRARYDESTATAESLFLELVVQKTPAEQFVQRTERRGFLLWQMQRAIVAAGIAGLVGCVLYAGSLTLERQSTREQIALQKREADSAASEYRRITESFPVTQTTSDNLRAAVAEYQAIVARSSTPDGALLELSAVLERFPQFALDELDWSVVRPGEAGATPPPGAAPPAAAGARTELIQLSGRLLGTPRTDFRAVTAQAESLGKAIGALPGYQVARVQLPFDVSPEGTLAGDSIVDEQSDEPTRLMLIVSRTRR